MNAEEALKLCRLAKAASPAQAVDDYTPELWALALGEERFADAQRAVLELAREQEWIHLSHIVKRVKRIRSQRLADFGPLPPPPHDLPDEDYIPWVREMNRRIADGEHVDRPALPAVDPEHQQRMRDLMRGAFQTPDEGRWRGCLSTT